MGIRGRGAEDALGVAIRVAVALWPCVLFELFLEAILAQGAQPCVVPKVEQAAHVAARGEAGLALVERRGDSAFVEGEEEGEAAWGAADDGDGGLQVLS